MKAKDSLVDNLLSLFHGRGSVILVPVNWCRENRPPPPFCRLRLVCRGEPSPRHAVVKLWSTG
ncbi:MAG TPA: hypothetical protein PL078_05880 [Bacillota bacterium]|nr:hypothetical protein [Peptococcaceae bacterium MAG4]NLW38202.1 hypothetical protein [Peptococcaceae bacterium]HPZ43517.1 hypothetical protein [Bacillota bacterium]HQD76345.1 hypothetical protein [Bacillota bacterium]HUM58262.1 hypothetical protein [Bacillota bacterium]